MGLELAWGLEGEETKMARGVGERGGGELKVCWEELASARHAEDSAMDALK